MMDRRQDWPERLAAWVEAVRARPFAWGTWDCAAAAADAVFWLTDSNPLAGLVWADVRGALRQLEVDGGLQAAVTARLGEPIAAAYAQRGDVVLTGRVWPGNGEIEDEAHIHLRTALCVCIGDRCVGPTRAGLGFLPMSEATLAWKVGRG